MVACGCGVRIWAAKPLPSGTVRPLRPKPHGRWALNNEIFRGYVFNIARSGYAAGDEFTLTCFDSLIYLAKNDHDAVYKNKTASKIIRELLEEAGIRVHPKRFMDTHTKIPRLVTNGLTVYDGCVMALQKTRSMTKKRYRLRMDGGFAVLFQREIRPDEAWLLTAKDSLIGASRTTSIEELVTSAELKSDGKSGRITELSGSTARFAALARKRYGRMHKIVDRGSSPASDGKTILDTLIKENGRPHEELNVTIPCINTMRAGDYVKVLDPDTGMHAHFWIDSVSHSVSSSQASSDLTLVRRIEEAETDTVESTDGTSETTRWVGERDGETGSSRPA